MRTLKAAILLASVVVSTAALAQGNAVTGEVKETYRVKDLSMLNQVNVGEKVQCEVERLDGGIAITKLQKAK
ncbi:hypothetical protein ACVIHI_008891 [Bradyrhizobium sp. USDA 4524]|uniref:copper-binding protein n=1 Tax=unclassified Bradyrhizobium TaxID=2631580 RepID=UPI0020A0274B|nr:MULTISPECIES: copper-binding protein [unclassified Bradyrhizobium]MCP1845640.1 hypothetical protein [Bradyrhizobium sp. USDA 4538]MCP1907036.1 hypothetical protein [Bradyrhizobium sp. USDA 4537]MCP1985512.1 hypothetical protein [Bradyrhizobium sp. USDA 4539]